MRRSVCVVLQEFSSLDANVLSGSGWECSFREVSLNKVLNGPDVTQSQADGWSTTTSHEPSSAEPLVGGTDCEGLDISFPLESL